jgi:uncharacterized small protein (DUF1192 family)
MSSSVLESLSEEELKKRIKSLQAQTKKAKDMLKLKQEEKNDHEALKKIVIKIPSKKK